MNIEQGILNCEGEDAIEEDATKKERPRRGRAFVVHPQARIEKKMSTKDHEAPPINR